MKSDSDLWGPVPAQPVIISKREAARRTGMSAVHLWRLEQRGEFPGRVLLDENGSRVGYLEHEISNWIRSRIRAGGRRLPPGCRGFEAEPKSSTRRRVRLHD